MGLAEATGTDWQCMSVIVIVTARFIVYLRKRSARPERIHPFVFFFHKSAFFHELKFSSLSQVDSL